MTSFCITVGYIYIYLYYNSESLYIYIFVYIYICPSQDLLPNRSTDRLEIFTQYSTRNSKINATIFSSLRDSVFELWVFEILPFLLLSANQRPTCINQSESECYY